MTLRQEFLVAVRFYFKLYRDHILGLAIAGFLTAAFVVGMYGVLPALIVLGATLTVIVAGLGFFAFLDHHDPVVLGLKKPFQ